MTSTFQSIGQLKRDQTCEFQKMKTSSNGTPKSKSMITGAVKRDPDFSEPNN